jgi:hypothetical protein
MESASQQASQMYLASIEALTRLLTRRFHVIGPNGPNRPMDQGPGRGPLGRVFLYFFCNFRDLGWRMGGLGAKSDFLVIWGEIFD